jgi:hypothetical protein
LLLCSNTKLLLFVLPINLAVGLFLVNLVEATS